MADEGTGILTQDDIDALFGEVPSGETVVDAGGSADGVTRAPTVGDMPEVDVAPPAAVAPPVAPVAPAAPVAPVAPVAPAAPAAPATAAIADARPWIQPDPGAIGGGVDPATFAVLEQRVVAIEAAVSRMAALEASITALTTQLSSGKMATSQDIQKLQGGVMRQMKSIMENLQATPGYGLKKTFKCSKCGDEHHVGTSVKCTNCQNESLVGWYPERGAQQPPASGQRRPTAPAGQRRPSAAVGPQGGSPGGSPPSNARRPPPRKPAPGRPPR